MLLNERDGLFDGANGEPADLGAIEDPALVGAGETSGLNPGVRKVPLAIDAEQQNTADGRHLAALVVGEQAERLEVALAERTNRGERLGSGSEVERFRVEIRHRLLVEGLTAGARRSS